MLKLIIRTKQWKLKWLVELPTYRWKIGAIHTYFTNPPTTALFSLLFCHTYESMSQILICGSETDYELLLSPQIHTYIYSYKHTYVWYSCEAIMIYGRVVPQPPPLLPPTVAEDGRKLLERSSNPLCEGSRHRHSLLLIRDVEADGRQMSFALFKGSTLEYAGQIVLRQYQRQAEK